MLRYGSLSKQQEICFPSCSWCIFSDLVCRFLLSLIIMDIDYGSICDDDDNVALWSNLERIYAHSEGEFMLVNHKQNHACGKACVIHGAILPTLCSVAEIASSFDMICFELFRESSVTQKQIPLGYFISQTMTSVCKFSLQLFYAHVLHCVCPLASILLEHNASQVLPLMELLEEFGLLGCKPVSTQMELNLKLSQDIGDFLLDVSSYHLLDVVSSECSKNRLIMVYCMCTLTRFGLFVKTEACWFEALLIFVGISSKWLDIHVRIGSQSCVSRHGELTMIIVEWILQRRHILLRHLSPAQVYEVIKSLYKEEAKPVAVTNDDFTLLLHGDGSFVGQEAVDDSVRLSTFIFGSLTRPPETHCVFSFKPWIFMSIDTSIIEKVMEDTH